MGIRDAGTLKTGLFWRVGAPVIFLLLWSSGFVFLKIGLNDAEPLTFLALRYACVVAVLLLAAVWYRPSFRIRIGTFGHLLMVGLLIQAGYFAFTYLSLKYGMSAGGVALITSQQPILVGLLAPVIAHERVGLVRWCGLILGVLGAAIVLLSKSSLAMGSMWGLWFACLALVCMTAGVLWEKRFGVQLNPLVSNLVQYAVGLLVSGVLALTLESMQVRWTAELWGSLVYLVFGNSLLAITLLLAMVRRGEASRVSALFFLVPPVTALIAFIALRETLSGMAIPGMALAGAGIYLVMRQSSAKGGELSSRDR